MSGQSHKCVYAGSFDPLTDGHMFMIREGAKLFDQLVVALGINPAKTYTFSEEDRLRVLNDCTQGIANVEVDRFEGAYLVNYAAAIGAGYILRGIRTQHDYEFERTMRQVNGDINSSITTVFMIPPRHLCELSSSFVKGLVGPEGWRELVKQYVPEPVYELIMRSKIAWPNQSGGPDHPGE